MTSIPFLVEEHQKDLEVDTTAFGLGVFVKPDLQGPWIVGETCHTVPSGFSKGKQDIRHARDAAPEVFEAISSGG